VVTGTLTGAPVAAGDPVRLLTRRGQQNARIRALESFGVAAEQLEPGRRAAVNLNGVSHRSLRRGDALVAPGQWHETDTFDAGLHVLPGAPRAVRSTGAHAVHVGSTEEVARLQVLGGRAIEPGGRGFVRIRLPRRVPLVPGDRFVLRDMGTGTTVGGGEILDVAPQLRPSKAAPDRDPWRVVRERGWVGADELERLTGARLAPTVGAWVVDPAAATDTRQRLHEAVDEAPPGGVDLASLDERTRSLVDSDEALEVRHGRVRRRGADDPFASHPYLAALQAALFQPPSPVEAGASMADVGELVRRGLVVREDDVWFSPAAVDGAAQAAADLLAAAPGGFTVSDLRLRLGTSRRFALALLTHLDREGVTRRRGDVRTGGPRLPGPGRRSG
jgi:selenocysteine-specific elongation factor